MRSLTSLSSGPEECASRALYSPSDKNTLEDSENDSDSSSLDEDSEQTPKKNVDIENAKSETKEERIKRLREKHTQILLKLMASQASADSPSTDEETRGKDKLETSGS